MNVRLSLAVGLLTAACGVSFGGEGPDQLTKPGLLQKLRHPGNYTAEVGDAFEFSIACYPAPRIHNNVKNLKVEVDGEGVVSKPSIVIAPPDNSASDGGGEIRAYIFALAEGEATVAVTPVPLQGNQSLTLKYRVEVKKNRYR
jgi:hypothetical protein